MFERLKEKVRAIFPQRIVENTGSGPAVKHVFTPENKYIKTRNMPSNVKGKPAEPGDIIIPGDWVSIFIRRIGNNINNEIVWVCCDSAIIPTTLDRCSNGEICGESVCRFARRRADNV